MILAAILVLLLALVAAPTSGPPRVVVAVAMAAIVLVIGVRRVARYRAIPPDEEIPVGNHEVAYVCTMCGLELKAEGTVRDKPPTHCREPMDLVGEGRPPLRSL